MTDLPAGTVTLLFADIEGLTQLVERLGKRYAEALADHRHLVNAAAKQAGGREIDVHGDELSLVFMRPEEAIAAAIQAQQALAGHSWPAGAELRVRMGIHTGEPAISEGSY